jgi:phosphodiesterase/alkaline phosphatase D-like protein
MAPLLPNQTYYYRWRYGAAVSDVGTFKTPPWPFVSTDVRFAFSGDADGTRVNGVPVYNNFEALDAARNEGLDFFIYLGDTVVADSLLRESPAETLDEYRKVYQENRQLQNLRTLLRDTSIYVIWDDHEVFDNYAGQTVDPERYANGREAFLEYMPVGLEHVPDPTCAGAPLFRVFHWGKDVDVIMLDARSCRSPSDDVERICQGDPAPTLPPPLRQELGAAFGLPPHPPAGCLAAIFAPTRTMLGQRQKALLKAALLFSTAKFKFVINEVPIQQFYVLPYDRWEGYGFERAELLGFIRLFGIDNVVFLSADFHGNLLNEVFIDRFLAPEPVAVEAVTGPIADVTVEKGLNADLSNAFKRFLKDKKGLDVECVHLDAFSYGLVEVNTSTGTATIMLKDDTGAVLRDQLDSRRCIKVIGP